MTTKNYYIVEWVSKTEAQLTNGVETIVLPLSEVKFLDFNRLFAKIEKATK